MVAHAPTDRDVKGTAHVVAGGRRAAAGGRGVRLDLIEDVTRDEALSASPRPTSSSTSSLLGWYGAVAVEAMALGRPVLAYIREDEPEDNPFGSKLPIVRTTAATLAADLRRLAADRADRHALGAAGRRFVEEQHDPRRIARRCLTALCRFPGGVATPASEQALSATARR